MKPVFVILAAAALAQPSSAQEARSTLEATSSVSSEQDGCLDHSVKELGMSAKKVESERRWKIGPQFLHPSVVQGGSLEVAMRKGKDESLILVTASWPGGLKAKELQAELADRVSSMARKMAQICGVTRPTVRCVSTAPGAGPSDCGPR